MTEDDFLTRWSRRKRAVAEAETPAPAPVAQAAGAVPEKLASPEDNETPFDPASLPSIDSINAVSDVTAFLRKGVPAELTRAALRRVWRADPAIRDFVGLAENAWDFTDPNAMPGFGPLESTEEVRQMIAKLVDGIGRVANPMPDAAIEDNSEKVIYPNETGQIEREAAFAPVAKPEEQPQKESVQDLGKLVLVQSNKEVIAMQRDDTEDSENSQQSPRRLHGSAAPQ